MSSGSPWRSSIAVAVAAAMLLAVAIGGRRIRILEPSPPPPVRTETGPGRSPGPPSLPKEPAAAPRPLQVPQGFVLLEPGFAIREDLRPKADAARKDLEQARARVAAIALELNSIAARQGIALSRKSPSWDLHAARFKLPKTAQEDGDRIGELLTELKQLEDVTFAGYPIWCFTPPGALLGLFDLVEGGPAIESAFWRDFLRSKVRIETTDVLDPEIAPGTLAVKRSYYPALVQRLEAWIARREALAADALAYLRDGLDRNLPDYAEIVARVGTEALNALLGTPGGDVAREAAIFLESRATPELRERLFVELRRATDGGTVIRLMGALPGRLSAQETGDLLQLLSRLPSGPASSALLRALAVRLPATEDAALARSFEALDAAAGRVSLPPADGAFYCVQRLKSVGSDRSETRAALERSLETLITAAEPKDRIQVVTYLSSLRSGETPRLLSRLAGDGNPQVAAAAGVSLARSLFEIRLPATDAILAKTLGTGNAPAVGAILDELSRGPKLPPGAVETAEAIRRLAESAPSEADQAP